MVGTLIGGVIGGGVGAAIWAGVTYFTGWEVGLIAWAIGLLVGVGAKLLGRPSAPGAVLAGVIALASVLLGKFGISYLWASNQQGGMQMAWDGFTRLFGIFDLLWIGLAVVSAYQLVAQSAEQSRSSADPAFEIGETDEPGEGRPRT